MKKRMVIILTAASIAVLSAVLATGCGKSGSSEGGSRENNKLNVYNWGEYIDEDVISQFEEETGIKVVYDASETNEEIYPVIEAGAVKYDMVCPLDYMVQRMSQNDLLVEIDLNDIPNYKEIGEDYLDISKEFGPENKYSASYCWGTMGILYNTKWLEELGVPAPTKRSDLWDECLSGEILMQNSVRDAFTAAPKMGDYSLSSTNPGELVQVRDFLIQQKPLVQVYVIDQVRDKVVGGEAAVGVTYSGEMFYIQKAVADQGLDYSLEYVTPEEGTSYWIDSRVIPTNVEHKENAEKWIDLLCRPNIAKRSLEYITYATPNKGAYDLLDDELKNNKALSPDIRSLPNCEIIKYLGDDVDIIYNDMWKEIKSEQI